VFAANDLMALGAIAALEDAGLRVPDDVSVAGFDDIMLASRVHPRLTTVHQPAYDVGRTAGAQLLSYVHRDEVPPASRHILPVRLKVRASTAPVRPLSDPLVPRASRPLGPDAPPPHPRTHTLERPCRDAPCPRRG
jgi:LacI family transcriptional regulator